MPKNTKKAVRAALLKQRRALRRKMAAHRLAKRSGPAKNRISKTHPHRRVGARRQRNAAR